MNGDHFGMTTERDVIFEQELNDFLDEHEEGVFNDNAEREEQFPNSNFQGCIW